MKLKMTYGNFEFTGEKEDLLDLMMELETKSASGTMPKAKSDWHWNEDSVDKLATILDGQKLNVVRAFKKNRTLKYRELCKLTGLRGQALSARLAAITKNSQRAVGHEKAWLIDHVWTVPGDRDERDYYIH